MFGFRILLFIVAYLVVLAEIVVGSMTTTPAKGAVWIGIGAVVIMLLLAISNFLLPTVYATDQQRFPRPTEWIVMAIAGAFIAGTAFFFDSPMSGFSIKEFLVE